MSLGSGLLDMHHVYRYRCNWSDRATFHHPQCLSCLVGHCCGVSGPPQAVMEADTADLRPPVSYSGLQDAMRPSDTLGENIDIMHVNLANYDLPGARCLMLALFPECLRTLVLLTLPSVVNRAPLESESSSLHCCLHRIWPIHGAVTQSGSAHNVADTPSLDKSAARLDMWGDALEWCSLPSTRGLDVLI